MSSLRELAGALGIPYTTIAVHRRNGLPAEPDGKFHVERSRQWIADYKAKGAGGADGKGNEWDEELKKAKAQKAMLDLAQSLSKVVEKSKVIEAQVLHDLEIKQALMTFPRDVAPRLLGCGIREIEAILTERIFGILRKLSRDEYKAWVDRAEQILKDAGLFEVSGNA
ncbi:hypothetical protein [Candidatus Nitrospira bockiana]